MLWVFHKFIIIFDIFLSEHINCLFLHRGCPCPKPRHQVKADLLNGGRDRRRRRFARADSTNPMPASQSSPKREQASEGEGQGAAPSRPSTAEDGGRSRRGEGQERTGQDWAGAGLRKAHVNPGGKNKRDSKQARSLSSPKLGVGQL